MKATLAIARAAGQDAGNRNAKKHGRTVWNDEDWDVACEVTAQIMATQAEQSRELTQFRDAKEKRRRGFVHNFGFEPPDPDSNPTYSPSEIKKGEP